jgi:AcrR family transcriptional regulator
LLPAARRLGDLRVERIGRGQLRVELGRTALEVAGEVGYDELTVDRILSRGGTSRTLFYSVFADVEDCYLAGYTEVSKRLVDGLLDQCRIAPDWAAGVRAALDALAEAIVASQVMANGVIVQIRSASRRALDAHDTTRSPLVAALDRGRDVAPAGLTPPPSAGSFVLASIDAAAAQALVRRDPREFATRVPDLAFLAVATYLGVGVARRSQID